MEGCKSVAVPITGYPDPEPDEELLQDVPYREAVGSMPTSNMLTIERSTDLNFIGLTLSLPSHEPLLNEQLFTRNEFFP